ncbi:MAG: hypothetical protein JST30_04955 [Armatimonadetes bacterium]|nr:hypothetical protein [Armatimonadota bacterium]
MTGTGTVLDPVRIQALELAKDRKPVPKEIGRLAASVGDEAARWAFLQWELRSRARSKFALAGQMLFDRESLEMATHEEVSAAVHILGFPEGKVVDLTTGIGGDLIALSQGRTAIGYETDAERAAMARHNLAVSGQDAEVRVEDCLEATWDFDLAFADPARRQGGERTFDPARFSPRLDVLAEKLRTLRAARVKLTPLLSDKDLDSLSPDRWFVSHASECKEALVHFGGFQGEHVAGVWAVQVESGSWSPGELTLRSTASEPSRFVFESDPALIRAHGLGCLGLDGLGDSNGYLTSEKAIESAWLRSRFEVRWHGAWRAAAVKTALRSTGARVVAVKQRGAGLDVAAVSRAVQTDGDVPLELLLYRNGQRVSAVLGERLGPG